MSRKRSASSTRWLAEHENDPYVREARKLGFRSRAVFKLREIQEKDRLIRPGMVAVDLGAAPGGWSQLARPLLGPQGRLIALDILPMDPLPEVEVITGDFRESAVMAELEGLIGTRAVDLVLSDMAPNVSGITTADQAGQIYLCELALEFARAHLKPGGDFLAKAFQGDGFEAFLKGLRQDFDSVSIRKPKASRARSREVYLLARRLKRV
ncbi:23S rRNA (uridine(2552)-2'-O)-methyltransferase RlmE [Panacagrimonas sp.]|uniref:23S rRNA (uridine(2552)-2'-O)-methyltransferase RlmE n=1 Tax=Panacagrimonas sp. TaxID=2480088 RepID=UPI003B52B862